jgi:NAD(P)H-nitrite reductase large subunit
MWYYMPMRTAKTHHADYLIIGGGMAGTAAAESIRALDERGSIAIVSKEPYPLYSRVLLPKYVEGAISREQVFLRTTEQYNQQRIDLFVGEEAAIVDPARREVHTRSGMVLFYKQLLVSAGGRVKPWRVQGSDTVKVHRFHTIEDANVLRERIAEQNASVVILGGGFIALELMNAVVPKRVPTRCIIAEQRFWETQLDESGSLFLEDHIQRSGVELIKNEIVTDVRTGGDGHSNLFTSRRNSYSASDIAVGIGLMRETEVFAGIGIEVKNGLVTNEFLETAVEHIWAAGDIAEAYHPIFEKYLLVGNWSNAFLQGRMAGANMAHKQLRREQKEAFANIPMYAVDILGLHITFLGETLCARNEKCEYVSRMQKAVFYERFVLRGGRLVGAVIMNKFEDKKVLEQLIITKADAMPFVQYFSNPSARLSDVL